MSKNHRTSAKYLDTSVLSAGVPLQKASFTFCLLSTVSEGEADKIFFFNKYFFPRVAEFHSWSSLLDYGLLFGDILQHNFHFYINDSFHSKLTILTSFSQKKNKQTNNKAWSTGRGRFVHYIHYQRKHNAKKEMLGWVSPQTLLSWIVRLPCQQHWLISPFTSFSGTSFQKNRGMAHDASLKESNFLKNYTIIHLAKQSNSSKQVRLDVQNWVLMILDIWNSYICTAVKKRI